MIRKAVIVVLTLALVIGSGGWLSSYSTTISCETPEVGGRSVYASFNEGWGTFRLTTKCCTSLPSEAVDFLRNMNATFITFAVSGESGSRWIAFVRYRHHKRAFYQLEPPLDCAVFEQAVLFPGSVLLLLLAAYPAIAFIRGPLRRWRRRKRGECVNCGYNLTGNVTGVCSECGTAV